jgi:dTDP-4-dehydrorhamnose 3,5-epimerase
MRIEKTAFRDLLIIHPRVFPDQRGYFFESFNENSFADATGLNLRFVQDNESRSSRGVLRGLHYQISPYAQSKLVRVVQGEVLDVVLDIRPDSPTYGEHFSIKLSGENKIQLFVPKGFAHGYAVLSEFAVFSYKCDTFYNKDHEAGIMYNDPSLDIDWMIPEKEQLISEKDAKQYAFADHVRFS